MKVMLLKNKINDFLNKGHKRSVSAKKNIMLSFSFRIISLAAGFIRLPLILRFIDKEFYGIWLTLSSTTHWFEFFKIGMNSGLRNKLAECIARDDKEKARIYVSTTYALITIIGTSLFIILLTANFFVDWTKILNAPSHLAKELSNAAIILFSCFALRFILGILSTILTAIQKPSIDDGIRTLSTLVYLAIIVVLIYTTKGSITIIAMATSITPVVVFSIATVVFFNGKYKYLRPSLKYVQFSHYKDLVNLGFKFFVIQISVAVMLYTDNIIISHVTSPGDVVTYNIARRYLEVTSMGFSIILAPLWSAYTQAYHDKDYVWIKATVKKLVKLWAVLCVGIVIMVLISDFVYKLWIGKEILVPFLLTSLMGVFFALNTWNTIFVYFINGVSKIKLQLVTSLFLTVLNIPLSIFFARTLNMGVSGVIMGTIVCVFAGTILHPIQYYKIINNKARGIWNK